ncbi:hypothetical protein DNO10_26720, partial [Escherichia coli]|nr:hypothetical protein [Escherichia coli]
FAPVGGDHVSRDGQAGRPSKFRHHFTSGEALFCAAWIFGIGKALNVPVCELLGPGKQREAITVLGYLFYIGDRTKTDLPYV